MSIINLKFDKFEHLIIHASEVQTEDFGSKLKTKVQTNKDKPDPTTVEPKQVDFRNVLKKGGSVKTKVNQTFKTEQVDFRNQALKNQGKPDH